MKRRNFLRICLTAVASAPLIGTELFASDNDKFENVADTNVVFHDGVAKGNHNHLNINSTSMTPRDWNRLADGIKIPDSRAKSKLVKKMSKKNNMKTKKIKLSKIKASDLAGLPVFA